jgi:DNA (cytosine-5)-methyltransferase 1
MNFGSVCSGIEAASEAWNPLGWRAQFLSEIDPFPCAVLAHHHPTVPNLGDMNNFKDWPNANLDVLCGGTPCQSFSNAGLRAGLDDPRGQLMLTFGAIAAKYRPRWLVWENVPGVLSSNGGRDFGAFLGLLGFLGYGFAYRVLDAQFVRVDGYGRAVPQRRNRVFVVGCLGDWRSAAAVLLERESLRGDSAPRRVSGARVAATLTRGAESSGRGGYAGRRQEDDVNIVAGVAPTLPARRNAGGGMGTDFDCDGGLVAHTLRAEGFDASEDGTGRGTPLVPVPFDTTQITSSQNRNNPKPGDPCHQLAAGAHAPAIASQERGRDGGRSLEIGGDVAYALTAPAAGGRAQERNIAAGTAVRRLMPVECERLQGFKDGHTAIMWRGKPAADGPRYKALGNSWAVNCARWIGQRIEAVEAIKPQNTERSGAERPTGAPCSTD